MLYMLYDNMYFVIKLSILIGQSILIGKHRHKCVDVKIHNIGSSMLTVIELHNQIIQIGFRWVLQIRGECSFWLFIC